MPTDPTLFRVALRDMERYGNAAIGDQREPGIDNLSRFIRSTIDVVKALAEQLDADH